MIPNDYYVSVRPQSLARFLPLCWITGRHKIHSPTEGLLPPTDVESTVFQNSDSKVVGFHLHAIAPGLEIDLSLRRDVTTTPRLEIDLSLRRDVLSVNINCDEIQKMQTITVHFEVVNECSK